jgi:hypothetical protein
MSNPDMLLIQAILISGRTESEFFYNALGALINRRALSGRRKRCRQSSEANLVNWWWV